MAGRVRRVRLSPLLIAKVVFFSLSIATVIFILTVRCPRLLSQGEFAHFLNEVWLSLWLTIGGVSILLFPNFPKRLGWISLALGSLGFATLALLWSPLWSRHPWEAYNTFASSFLLFTWGLAGVRGPGWVRATLRAPGPPERAAAEDPYGELLRAYSLVYSGSKAKDVLDRRIAELVGRGLSFEEAVAELRRRWRLP